MEDDAATFVQGHADGTDAAVETVLRQVAQFVVAECSVGPR